MALSIKGEEADRLARELAAATHESLTDAVTIALRERLQRVRSQGSIDITFRLNRLMVEYTGQPIHDHRSADDIIGYDADGLPA